MGTKQGIYSREHDRLIRIAAQEGQPSGKDEHGSARAVFQGIEKKVLGGRGE